MRDRYLGVKIPPTNLKPDFVDQAQAFANELATHLVGLTVMRPVVPADQVI